MSSAALLYGLTVSGTGSFTGKTLLPALANSSMNEFAAVTLITPFW
jgi:hypothetical protein